MQLVILFVFSISIGICVSPTETYAQHACALMTTETNRWFGGNERKSREAISFRLEKNLTGELRFSNLGRPLTIQMSLDFKDSLGYPEDAGQLLTIEFKDGSSQQLIPSAKKSYSGTVLFSLIKPKDKRMKILSDEDVLFFEKLRDVNIMSFKLTVGEFPRVIAVSGEQGDVIKNIVVCLVD